MFKDKTLLITGGTGSFGNAILNRFLCGDIGEIRIFSRDEKKQDDMRHDFQARFPKVSDKIKFFIGDVRDIALFALLAGTATTFSVATPLLAEIVVTLFGISISRTVVAIIILLITCTVYTYAVLHGFKGISILAKFCIYLFFGLQIAFLLIGGQGRFIVENGIESLGKMVQNFIGLSTYMDPARTNNFPQDWTIYYWAYWMVWCIAVPFFIGNISRGRTVRQTIMGGYIFGVGSTISSFIIFEITVWSSDRRYSGFHCSMKQVVIYMNLL